MGFTPILQLPYPELNDAANVPTDMHELASAIEVVVGGVLPVPKTGRTSTVQQINSVDAAPWQACTPLVSLLNPHPSLFLLVAIEVSATVNSVNTVTYVDTKASGHTSLHLGVACRVMSDWRGDRMRSIATVAPGAMLSAQPSAHRLSGAGSDLLNADVILTPVGWLKTGTIT